MKRIGLLGGMSWESTAEYYRRPNEEVRDRLVEAGGHPRGVQIVALRYRRSGSTR